MVLALALALGAPGTLRGQYWPSTGCTADRTPYVRMACAFEVTAIPRLADPDALGFGATRIDREIRFWTVTAWTVPTYLARVWQQGDSVQGQALMVVSAGLDTVPAYAQLCGRGWTRHDAYICEMRHSSDIDWRDFLARIDAAGVTEMPASPVQRAPCARSRFVDSIGKPEPLCPMILDGDSEGIEYRSGPVYWRYGFEPLPDTSSSGLVRDRAILRAWDCVRRRLVGAGCSPASMDGAPGLRWVTRRPVSAAWRPTVGLLAFGADSLVRTALPDGVREWRIQLDCLGCTPGVVLRIVEDQAGVVRGIAYLLAGRAEEPGVGTASEEYDAHLRTLQSAASCGPVVRIGWGDLEACEVGLSLDWATVLERVRESGILEALADGGRMVGPPFDPRAPTPRIETVLLAGPRMVMQHAPGPCAEGPGKELIIEELAGQRYRAGSFGCLQVAGDAESAHGRRAALREWLGRLLLVERGR